MKLMVLYSRSAVSEPRPVDRKFAPCRNEVGEAIRRIVAEHHLGEPSDAVLGAVGQLDRCVADDATRIDCDCALVVRQRQASNRRPARPEVPRMATHLVVETGVDPVTFRFSGGRSAD
jgi:hypothetical protein